MFRRVAIGHSIDCAYFVALGKEKAKNNKSCFPSVDSDIDVDDQAHVQVDISSRRGTWSQRSVTRKSSIRAIMRAQCVPLQ